MVKVHSQSMNLTKTIFCWLLALSLSWTNFTNGWMWITYASVSDFTSQYYEVSLNQVNWISLLYAVIMTVGVIPFIWIIHNYGVKVALISSSLLNLICALLHFISSSSFVNVYHRYIILIIGSIFGGFAQPLCLFSSTKLAATWFSSEHRISANTLAAMGNPLGALLSNILSPLVVTNKSHIPLLNSLNLIPSLFGVALVLLAVLLAPKHQNSAATYETVSFVHQIRCCVKNVHFWILSICFGMLLASFTAISTLIQQILCPLGYSDLFSGICGALFISMGIPGVLVVGPIVTRTKALKEIVKGGVVLTTIGLIAFSITSTLYDQYFLVAFSVALMGLFGFGIYPTALELAAETAYPAGEIISTGLLITLSQMLSFIFIMVAQSITVSAPLLAALSVCSVIDKRSYWISNMVFAIVNVINATFFLFIFNTDYKRVQSETNVIHSGIVYSPILEE